MELVTGHCDVCKHGAILYPAKKNLPDGVVRIGLCYYCRELLKRSKARQVSREFAIPKHQVS